MLFKNVSPQTVDMIARKLDMEAYRQSGDARRAVLRPTPTSVFRRRSNTGRKVHAICWHGHRDFFRELFRECPEAIVETALGPERDQKTRYTADNFEATFEETGYRNIGSMVYPMQAREACSCPEGAF